MAILVQNLEGPLAWLARLSMAANTYYLLSFRRVPLTNVECGTAIIPVDEKTFNQFMFVHIAKSYNRTVPETTQPDEHCEAIGPPPKCIPATGPGHSPRRQAYCREDCETRI